MSTQEASPASLEQAKPGYTPTTAELTKELYKQGHNAGAIAKQLDKPVTTIAPILSRLRKEELAHQAGALAGAKASAGQREEKKVTSALPSPPVSEEERSRRAALRLLNRVRAGTTGISDARIDAAKAILTKIKAPQDSEADKASVYSSMVDEELADHVLTSACAVLGIAKAREVLDRLEREGTLIKSGDEIRQAADLESVTS